MGPVIELRSDAVALAFHSGYLDRLGWQDLFASHARTARQSQQQPSNGARFSYTPQRVMDGKDQKDWINTRLPLKATVSAQAQISLTLESHQIKANI